MVLVFESLQEAILKSEKEFNGGRAELCRRMGLTYDAFRNRLRADRPDQQFTATQLEDIEFITGKPYVSQYFAGKSGYLLVKIPESNIDSQELSEIQIDEAAAIGKVNIELAKALADDRIDTNEALVIKRATMDAVGKLLHSKLSAISVYGE